MKTTTWLDRTRRAMRRRRLTACAAAVGMLAAVGVVVVTAPSAEAVPIPWSCTQYGYLFQTPDNVNHYVQQVDLASGASTVIGQTPHNVNAVGFNATDNYFYAWDNDTHTVVRISSDLTLENLGKPIGYPAGNAFTGTDFNVGDFDAAGHLWMMTSNRANSNVSVSAWIEIDYAAGSPNYGRVVSSGTLTLPSNATFGADWSFVNGALYAVGPSSTVGAAARLFRFDPVTHTMTNLGALAGVASPSSNFGATYADGTYLYVSRNTDGQIFRVDPAARTAAAISSGPPSSGNDGARCVASIPTVTLIKQVGLRADVNDQFTVSIGRDGTVLDSAATTGTGTSATTTNWPVSVGQAITLTDAMTAGSPSAIGAYQASIACVNQTSGATVTPTGTAPTWTLTPTTGDPYVCTITNTAPTDAALTLVKSASPSDIGSFIEGQVISYSFVVTNSGNVPVSAIAITETSFTGTGTAPAPSCPAGTLAPGAQTTCTASYTLTAADIIAGTVSNTAHATGTGPSGTVTSNDSSTEVPGVGAPALTVDKTVAPTAVDAAGSQVTYSFLVTNTGNTALTGVAITEGPFSGTGTLSAIVCPGATLLPGGQTTCTATYTATQADIDAGGWTNTAHSTATAPGNTPVTSPDDDAAVVATAAPALSLIKSASPQVADRAGTLVNYTFDVTNTGNVTVSTVTIDETSFTGAGTAPAVSCPSTPLAPGDTLTCTGTYTVTQGDLDGPDGAILNEATATGTTPDGSDITSPPATADVRIVPVPALTLVKSASVTTAAQLVAGASDVFTFTVTNTGNVTITGLTINDTNFSGSGTLPTPVCVATTLAPQTNTTCTSTYTITQADVDAGTLTNTATATGNTPGGGTTTSNESSTSVQGQELPSLTLVKSVSPSAAASFVVGQILDYSFVVTNTGNVTVSGIALNELAYTGSTPMTTPTCPATSLAPGISMTCTATATIAQADVDRGTIENKAVASGTTPSGGPVDSNPSTAIAPADPMPGLGLVKSVSPSDAASFTVGQVLTYTYAVTNTGNVTMSGITITETTFTGLGTRPIPVCPAGSIVPGATITCSAVYTVTQDDVDAGTVTNVAVASGTGPDGTPTSSTESSTTVPSVPAPAVTVVKSVSPSDVASFTAGQSVTYSFVVTNTGNVTLGGIAIRDAGFTGTGVLATPACPLGPLAPGAQMTCTTQYTLTAADIGLGKITNTAVAMGTPPGQPPVVSGESDAEVPAAQHPGVALVKTGTLTGQFTAGATVTYSFVVTNTGDVTLTAVAISETTFSGTGTLLPVSCPVTTLDPGQVTTCSTSYTVTSADVTAGSLTNTATASGTTPDGTSTSSAPSTARVPAAPVPAPAPAPMPGTGAEVGTLTLLAVLFAGVGIVLGAVRRKYSR